MYKCGKYFKKCDMHFQKIHAGAKVSHFKALQTSYAAGDRLILTFEILTDKFEEATFFSSRYIAFYGRSFQLFSHPVAETSEFEVMEI